MLILFFLLTLFFHPPFVSAQSVNWSDGLQLENGSTLICAEKKFVYDKEGNPVLDEKGEPVFYEVATIAGFFCAIANVISVVFTVLGFGGLIILIIGGFRYMFSGGNPQGMQAARRSITGVVIGLILALSSFLILTMISNVTGLSSVASLWIPAHDEQPSE